jgi:hypothetical protein
VRIGGTTAAARNVISGNDTGIFFSNIMPRNNVIEGNYIGTDPSGTIAVPNNVGVDVLRATETRIGGAAPGARNVIAGNNNTGVKIEFMGTGTVVQENFIGVDVNGAPLPNAFHGVELVNAATNTIGPDNVISHNGRMGISVSGNDNLIEGNVISFNGMEGIEIGGFPQFVGNAIRQNAIFSNDQLGIDLLPHLPTPNDPGDADIGPNNLQNYPVLDSPTSGGSSRVTGSPEPVNNFETPAVPNLV